MPHLQRELVLVHGRSQEHKDSVALKKEWLDALKEGLAKSGLKLPIPDDQVRFPYFGDTLDQLVAGMSEEDAEKVVVRGPEGLDDPELQRFVAQVLEEVADRHAITDGQKLAVAQAAAIARGEPAVVERGPLNWGWVRGLLRVLDQHVPGASGLSVALFTRDVYLYLKNGRVRKSINSGVQQALTPGVESVVVGHSLGSVVAYWLLAEQGEDNGWKVPSFFTVGSPLAVTEVKQTIRQELGLLQHPSCVGKWFNAMDPDDVVALYPLDNEHFAVDPQIENKTDVDNQTSNQHGIRGYLNNPDIAKRIYDALVTPSENSTGNAGTQQ
jgi:hypothetical protein